MLESALSRVAFCDPEYPHGWVHSPELIAAAFAQRHGFVVLGAERLGAWMRAQTQSGSAPSSVCILTHGMAPDTIFESASKWCTIRKYLDAGGRVVWIGDVPFCHQGRVGGNKKEFGSVAHNAVLGMSHQWQVLGKAETTLEGREWGLILPAEENPERCTPKGEVIPLSFVGASAASWFKSYHPQHPRQGFLRYRGSGFKAEHWNAMLNELCRVALRGLEEPWRAPRSWREEASERLGRVVFNDSRYPVSWSAEVPETAKRLAEAHGFAPLDAEALQRWMRARVAGGAAGSVCVLLHGIAPDRIFERPSPDCLVRRYLDAGGRLVWAGDTPFGYVGRPDGGRSEHGFGGHEAVLDILVHTEWEVAAPPAITEAGKAWGLRTVDEAFRCTDASTVTEVLAGTGPLATTWLRTYAPSVPGSGFLRFRGGAFGGLKHADELAAVALHRLPVPDLIRAGEQAPVVVSGDRVGGGSFQVDRGRALDKLMRFMLPAPELFVLPLARAAAAGGASRLRVTGGLRGLCLEFNGAPIAEADLIDPFRALVSGNPEPGLRAIALAVVTALRSGCVVLGSRGVARRYRSAEPGEACDYKPHIATFNYIHIEAGASGPLAPKALLKLLARHGAALQLVLEDAHGPFSSSEDEYTVTLPFKDGAVRGLLRAPSAPPAASTLEACVYGVAAGSLSLVLPEVQVEGWVNDDTMSLSLSQTSVVRDERWHELAAVLAPQAVRLALLAASVVRKSRGRRSERLGTAGFEVLWRNHVSRERPSALRRAQAALSAGVIFKKRAAAETEMIREARAARWLRGLARQCLHNLESDASNPLRRALWKTPLFLTADGRGLSLEAIERARRADGLVRTSSKLDVESNLGRRFVVWLEAPAERDLLRRFFGNAVRDVAEDAPSLLRRLTSTHGPLGQAGVDGLLAHRPFGTEGHSGEIGLKLVPHAEGGARHHGLENGKPSRFQHVGGPLRYEAAMEGTIGDGFVRDAAAAIDDLYRSLAGSLTCPVSFGLAGVPAAIGRWFKGGTQPREKAALEHLRDYLQWSLASGAPAGWIRDVPLFEMRSGWASYEDVRRQLDDEGVLVLSDGYWWLDHVLEGPILRDRQATGHRLRASFSHLQSSSFEYGNIELLYRRPAALNCAHQAPFGCLAQGEVGGKTVHLAVSLKGEAMVYPADEGPPESIPLARAGGLAVIAATAILLKAPQAVEAGDHPWRRFVLAAARELLPSEPLTGGGMGLFRNLLFMVPLIRPNRRMLLSILQNLRANYALYGPPESGANTGLILDEDELALIRALWPEEAKLLVTQEEFQALQKRLVDRPVSRETVLEARSTTEIQSGLRGHENPVEGAKAMLSELAMRQGLALFWRDAAAIHAKVGKGKKILSHPDPKEWTLDTGHASVRGVLDSRLPPEQQADYLASLMHTAANRLLAGVNDKDDSTFHEALSGAALEERPEAPAAEVTPRNIPTA